MAEYYKITDSNLNYKGERYFRYDCQAEKVVQVTINAGEAKKGRNCTIGIYNIHRTSFAGNYLGTKYVEVCPKELYDQKFEEAVSIMRNGNEPKKPDFEGAISADTIKTLVALNYSVSVLPELNQVKVVVRDLKTEMDVVQYLLTDNFTNDKIDDCVIWCMCALAARKSGNKKKKFTPEQLKKIQSVFEKMNEGRDDYYCRAFALDHDDTYWTILADDTRVYMDAVLFEPNEIHLYNIRLLPHSGRTGKHRTIEAFENRTQISLATLKERLEALGFIKIKGDIVVR